MKHTLALSIFLSSVAWAQTPCQIYVDATPSVILPNGKAQTQQNALWSHVLASEYKQLPPLNQKERVLNLNPAMAHKQLMELRLRAFDVTGDVRRVTDHKMTHINGPAALAKVVFEPGPFTGMFSAGEQLTLIRTSFAFNPTKTTGPHDFPQPGLAVKFFASFVPTLNVLAMGSLDGEGSDGRFFSTPMATKLEPPKSLKGKVGEAIFKASTHSPGHLRLDHLARVNSDGSTVKTPVTPEWIVFAPTELSKTFGKKDARDFRDEILKIPAGSRIYTIHGALKKPDGTMVRLKMGYLETTSRFVASEFADRKLHFRHEGATATPNYLDFIRWQCGE